MKNLLLKLIFGIILIPLTFSSCQKDMVDESLMKDDIVLKNGAVLDCQQIFSLKAGQDILVGTLTVGISGDKLMVTFNTWGSWFMSNTKLCIVTDPIEFPVNKGGNPKVGQFPVKDDWPGLTNEATYEFELGTGIIYIAAHADVVMLVNGEVTQCETAWGYDCNGSCVEFPGASWGWYLIYEFCEPI